MSRSAGTGSVFFAATIDNIPQSCLSHWTMSQKSFYAGTPNQLHCSQLCTILPSCLFSTCSYGRTLSCFHSPALTKLLWRTSCCACEAVRVGVQEWDFWIGTASISTSVRQAPPSGCSDWHTAHGLPVFLPLSQLWVLAVMYISLCLHHGWVNAVFSIVCLLRMVFKFLKE